MMLFNSEKEITIDPNSTSTMQTYDAKVIGDLVGHDSVYINGEVDGCVIVDNIVVVGEEAKVKGKIQAQHVIVHGEVKGRIECDYLEIKKDALVVANTEAREIRVLGKLQGEVIAYDLTAEEGSFIGTVIQVNRLEIKGSVIGDISSDALHLYENAYVKGDLYVNGFMNEGASIKGEVKEYKRLLHQKTNLSSNQAQNLNNLKDAINKYINNSEYINDILKQKCDSADRVTKLVEFIKEHISSDEEILKVTRLINYSD